MILEKVKIPIYIDISLKSNLPINVFNVNTDKTAIVENLEYFNVKQEYMNLIQSFRENESDQFIGGMPVQLQKDCMGQLLRGTSYQKLIYGITLKVNGVRHLMFLSKTGNLYFIDRITNFYYFKRPDGLVVNFAPTNFPFLFDGELVLHKNGQWEFLVFDVIFYQDKGVIYNWISNNYYDRLHIMDRAVNDLSNFKDIFITLKTWFPIETIKATNNIYKHVIDLTNKERNGKPVLEEDGLILQPFDGNYITFREWNVFNNVQFKWKPPEQLTVDFKIKFNPDNKKQWWLLTKSEQNYDVKQPNGETVHAIIIPTETDLRKYKENDIVECKLKEKGLNPQRNIFTPILKREDKTEGNSLQTIMSTMEAVIKPFTLDILKPAINAILTNTHEEEILKFYNVSKLILCSIDMFFTESEISEIKKVYNIYCGNVSFGRIGDTFEDKLLELKKPLKISGDYELEFRIYPYIKKGKKENITKFTYFYLLDFLMKSGLKFNYNFSIDIILNDTFKDETYRSTYTNFELKKPINQIKRKIKEYRAKPTNDKQLFNNLTFKLSLSTESSSPVTVGLKSQLHDKVVYNTIRVKQRHSFHTELWRLDITRVITTMNIKDLTNETYEIECEYTGSNKIPFQTFIKSMNDIYKLILHNTSYC